MCKRSLSLFTVIVVLINSASIAFAELKSIHTGGKNLIVDTTTGEFLFPPNQFDSVEVIGEKGGYTVPESYKYFRVKKQGKYGVVDLSGNVILDFSFNSIQFLAFADRAPIGFIVGVTKDYAPKKRLKKLTPEIWSNPEMYAGTTKSMFGLFDLKGEEILSIIYDEISLSVNNFYKVSLNNKYGIVSKGDEIIVPIEYDNIEHVKVVSEGMGSFTTRIGYKEENKLFNFGMGVKNKIEKYKVNDGYRFRIKGGKDISSEVFDDAYDFKNGYGRFKKDGKWGFIDDNGKIVIEPKYNYVWDYDGEKAKVRFEDMSTKYIDMRGKILDE